MYARAEVSKVRLIARIWSSKTAQSHGHIDSLATMESNLMSNWQQVIWFSETTSSLSGGIPSALL